MPVFGKSSLAQLATADPRLRIIAHDVIKVIDHTIVKGHRNEADQNKAFAEGKTKLRWPNGNHNASPSRAIDVAPVYYEAGMKIDWNDLGAFGRLIGAYHYAAHIRGVALRFGIDWDGDFRSVGPDPDESFLDAPHIELVDP